LNESIESLKSRHDDLEKNIESKLSGIGTLHFAGASELILNPYLSGYSLMYSAVHGSDDWIPGK
jgi:hypothetical protein